MRRHAYLVYLIAIATLSCKGADTGPREFQTSELAGTWLAQSFAFAGITDSMRLTLTISQAEVVGTGERWINSSVHLPLQYHGRVSSLEVAGELVELPNDSLPFGRDSLWLLPYGKRLYGQIALQNADRIIAPTFELVRISR